MTQALSTGFLPFGNHACEQEVASSRELYADMFFFGAKINAEAGHRETYLLDGRRGSGKTAIATSFSFGQTGTGSGVIALTQETLLCGLVKRLIGTLNETGEAEQGIATRLWDHILWGCVFARLREKDSAIETALRICSVGKDPRGVDPYLDRIDECSQKQSRDFEGLWKILRKQSPDLQKKIDAGIRASLAILAKEPLVITIDSAENYNVDDPDIKLGLAALIQKAEQINRELAPKGLHVKLFLNGESFYDIADDVVQNYSKHVRSRVQLVWTAKELIRLACYRLHKNLLRADRLPAQMPRTVTQEQWHSHKFARTEIWDVYFDRKVTSRIGKEEDSWLYVLRHTQMQPRQLIRMCNAIARRAEGRGETGPVSGKSIREAVASEEGELATEVFNAYKNVYPKAGRIIEALSSPISEEDVGMKAMLTGADLHRIAPRSRDYWPADYQKERFVQILVDLGVVGKVRSISPSNLIEADFQYNMPTRLSINETDRCVVHPMFSMLLGRSMQGQQGIVYPFPDSRQAALEDGDG